MRLRSLLAGLALLALPAPALEAAPRQPVGSALVVVNMVTAEFNRDTRTLQVGDRVNQDETIEVGLDASSELKLDDDTKLALGPGSHLTLDKFVYDPTKAKGSIVLDLVKGTFRFMTGVAEKPTYVIKTPTAAITVRGTIFDVYVEDNGQSWLLLHEGAIQVCNSRGQCKLLDEPGKLIRISEDGAVGPPSRWASLSGKDGVSFDNAFPFVGKTPSIDPNPVLARDVILGAVTEPDPPRKTEKPKRYPKPTKRAERGGDDDDGPSYRPKKRYEKKRRAEDRKAARAVGAAIGLGLAIGIAKHKYGGHGHGGMGGYPGGRGKMGRY